MYILPILAGILLAAATGFRVFLPLAALSWAANLNYFELQPSLGWLGTKTAAGILTAAVVIEILADKFPAVDNFLDSINTFVKPIAGALVMAAPLISLDPAYAIVIGIAAGSTVAGGIHLLKAKARLAANLLTFGLAAPVLSVAEDAFTLLVIAAAIFVPLVGLVLVGVIFFFLIRKQAPELT